MPRLSKPEQPLLGSSRDLKYVRSSPSADAAQCADCAVVSDRSTEGIADTKGGLTA